MYGIPDFRLDRKVVNRVVDNAISLGLEIKTNVEFGKDISIDSLKKSGYDAIFLGIGAAIPSTYAIADKQYKNIYKSDVFLKEYSEGRKIPDLGITVVIGGGNVAMDCSRTAVRMGAKEVYILYRRDEENMPARKIEREEAIEDGVKINYLTKVLKAFGTDEKIDSIECMKTKVVDGKAVDIENSNFTMEANTIVFAIGLTPDSELLDKMNIENDRGTIKLDDNNMTSIEGVFAGGDLVEKKSTVCRAIASGKKAAIGIEEYLK